MIALFDKELMRMEQEVRDLKTAHDIPLGSVNFYKRSGSVSWSDDFIGHIIYYRITLRSGGISEPLLSIWTTSTQGGYVSSTATNGWEDDGVQIQILQAFFSFGDDNSMSATITCSSDFDLIIKEYEDGDWIGDLPDGVEGI